MSDTLLWSAAGVTLSAMAGTIALHSHQKKLGREVDRTEAARLLGWDYQPLDAGFTLVGRQIGRPWELVVSEVDSARWSTWTLGAPDIDRPIIVLSQRRAAQYQSHLTEQVFGSERLRKRFQLWCDDPHIAQQMIDAELEQLLLHWSSSNHWLGHHFSELTIWVCPHGVRITMNRALGQWPDLQQLVSLGLTVSLRSGIL
jgi:hypothetical protein